MDDTNPQTATPYSDTLHPSAPRAQVFLDGSATATVQLPLVTPGENLTVSFGTDDAVRVKELPVARTEEDKGLFFGETKKRTVRTPQHLGLARLSSSS